MKGFREFILRGNVVDLAIAVVLGLAFTAVVAAFVADLITPLIGIPGKADFSSLTFQINGSVFRYGAFINAIIAFLIIAAVIYFAVVAPTSKLKARRAEPSVDVTTRKCLECFSDIDKRATRCAFCTAQVSPQP